MSKYFNQTSVTKCSAKILVLICLVSIASIVNSSLAVAVQNNQELIAIDNAHFDSFRISDKAKLPASKQIFITEVSAKFSRDWLVKFRRDTTKDYRNMILRDYSQMLTQHIKAKLISSGWNVIDNYEEGVLSVRAELKNLYINGPEVLNRQHMLVKNVGHSSIEIIVNGADGKPIIIIEDKRNAGGTGSFVETNNATNFTWFNKLTEAWATVFVVYLDMSTSEIPQKR